MTNESLNENQKIYITEKNRLELFHKIEPFGDYSKEYAFSTDCLERYCSGNTGLSDYAYSHIRSLLKKEFKEYCKENNLSISKENLNNILDSYNTLDCKIRYIAAEILGIHYSIDKWEICDKTVDLQWDESCYGECYIEYESFPTYFLTINSYQELKEAWQKVKDERAEYTRKVEEERKKKEKEDQEKKEKILYEQLKAKYGEW